MGDLLADLRRRAAAQASTRRILLAEGDDPRVLGAAERLAAEGICRPVLVGAPAAVAAAARAAGVAMAAEVVDPAADPEIDELRSRLAARLASPGADQRGARCAVPRPALRGARGGRRRGRTGR